jgi:hypothetical protein
LLLLFESLPQLSDEWFPTFPMNLIAPHGHSITHVLNQVIEQQLKYLRVLRLESLARCFPKTDEAHRVRILSIAPFTESVYIARYLSYRGRVVPPTNPAQSILLYVLIVRVNPLFIQLTPGALHLCEYHIDRTVTNQPPIALEDKVPLAFIGVLESDG